MEDKKTLRKSTIKPEQHKCTHTAIYSHRATSSKCINISYLFLFPSHSAMFFVYLLQVQLHGRVVRGMCSLSWHDDDASGTHEHTGSRSMETSQHTHVASTSRALSRSFAWLAILEDFVCFPKHIHTHTHAQTLTRTHIMRDAIALFVVPRSLCAFVGS